MEIAPHALKMLTGALRAAGRHDQAITGLDEALAHMDDGIRSMQYLREGDRFAFDAQAVGLHRSHAATKLGWIATDALPPAALDAIEGARNVLVSMPQVRVPSDLVTTRANFADAAGLLARARTEIDGSAEALARQILSAT